MEKSEQLGGQEYLALLIIVMSTIIFFNTPRRFFILADNAAWLSVIIAIAVAVACMVIIGLLLKRHPGKGLMELTVMILGPVFGSAVNLLFTLYFLVAGALNARLLAEAIIMTTLPEIPVSIIVATTVLFTLYAVNKGWNALAKACWVSLPFLAIGVVIPLILTADRWNADLLYPILGAGIQPVMLGGITSAGILGEIVLAPILARTLQPEVAPWRVGVVAVTASGLLFLSVVLATSMVFPFPVASQLTLPYYMLSRTLTIGRFLQRLEAIALLLWAFAGIMKIAIDSNATIYVYSQVFGIKDNRPLVLPYGVVLFSLAMIPKSFLATTEIIWWVLRIYGGAVALLLPVLIAIIGLIRLKPSAGREENA